MNYFLKCFENIFFLQYKVTRCIEAFFSLALRYTTFSEIFDTAYDTIGTE